MLPSLQLLELSVLWNLIGICPQNCHASWPYLRVVRWEYCQRLTTWWICSEQHQNVFISLPDSKEVFRGLPVLGLLEKLEELRISKCQNVLNIFPKEAQLCNLKILDLCGCGAVTLFSMSVAASLQLLAELSIKECEHLRHIITSEGGEASVALHNSHSIFPNLKKVDVFKCDKLQFVFPISCGQQGLPQLQEIKIRYCNELEYVFGPHDQEQNNSSHDRNEIQIMLPSLQVFELNWLGNLIGMCPQNCHASWPSLRKLYWYDCPRFTASWICSEQHQNVGVASTDDHIKHFVFELESLWSKGLSELRLICFNPQILSFQYLQSLDVENCSRQKYIFPRTIQINLPELTSLSIAGCDELEEIIANNEEEPQNHSNAQVYLPKLKNLYIFRCNKLKSLFSFAMAETLPQLKSLCVQECAQLKEILRCTANEGKIVLPNLSSITLHGLPRLVDICQGFVLHTLLQLQSLWIRGCPNFSFGATQVVPLDYITEEGLILWEINTSSNQLSQQQMLPLALQSFLNMESVVLQDSCGVELAGILKIKVEGVLHLAQHSLHSDLESLCLINLPKLRFIWSDPISILGFHELKHVYVEGCSKLKTIFPPGIVGSLQNLESFCISNCEELEDLIIVPPDLNVICLLKLRKIEVDKCPKLKCLLSASMGCDFPRLLSLNIKECHKLKCLFSGLMICNLPELYNIKIQECSELERVFDFKHIEVGDDEDGDHHGERQLTLPKLKVLKLESLPNFTEVEKLNMQVRQSYY